MENEIKYAESCPFHKCRFCGFSVRKWFRNEYIDTYKDQDGNVHEYKAVSYVSGYNRLKRHMEFHHWKYVEFVEGSLFKIDDILEYTEERNGG